MIKLEINIIYLILIFIWFKYKYSIWQTTPAPEGTSVTCYFKLSPSKFVTCINRWKFVEPDEKKVQHGTSGSTIYHRVTQLNHRVPQFFIGFGNFSTKSHILQVSIWNTWLHLYNRRGPAWSVIYISIF